MISNSYARYRWREKHKKQYTFTKTKMFVGFIISVLMSIFIGTYMENYGRLVLKQSVDAIASIFEEAP